MTDVSLRSVSSETVHIVEICAPPSYKLLVCTPAGTETFPSEIGAVALVGLAEALRNSVPAACREARDFLRLSADERLDGLRSVAKAGQALFSALCPRPERRLMFKRLLEAHEGKPIRAVMGAAAIPWEALCLTDDWRQARPEDFLGWNHAVVRETSGFRRVNPRSTRTASGRIGLGLVEDDQLPSVISGKNRTALDWMSDDVECVPLGALTAPEEVSKLHAFFSDPERPQQLFQIDCHVERPGPVELSHLRISERFEVEFDEFKPERLVVVNSPFVLLNVCGGGTVSDDSSDGYAKRLRESGAHAILSTEAAVGDDFAAEFAQTFYAAAGGGATVSEALLMTRRMFLAYDHNPTVLFYGLYGDGRHRLGIGPVPPESLAEHLAARLAVLGRHRPAGWGTAGEGGRGEWA